MSASYLKDAVFSLLKLKLLKKYIVTRKAIREKINLSDLTLEELESRKYLNPWLLNFYEYFFSFVAAIFFVYLLIVLKWGELVFSLEVKSVVAPLPIFLYLIITSYIITYFSLGISSLKIKKHRSRAINAVLFVSGSYGMLAKFVVAFTSVFIHLLITNLGHSEINSFINEYVLMIFPVATLLIFFSMIYEFHVFSSVIKYSGKMLENISFSSFRVKLISFLLIFFPTLSVGYYFNVNIISSIMSELSLSDILVLKLCFLSAVVLMLGWGAFVYSKNKLSIAKCSLIASFFINVPACSSSGDNSGSYLTIPSPIMPPQKGDECVRY